MIRLLFLVALNYETNANTPCHHSLKDDSIMRALSSGSGRKSKKLKRKKNPSKERKMPPAMDVIDNCKIFLLQ